MQPEQPKGEDQAPKQSEPVVVTPLVTNQTSSFELPIMGTEKTHKGLGMGIMIGVAVLVLVSLGMWSVVMLLNKPKVATQDATTAAQSSALPEGWKKFTSKVYGVSFVVPAGWETEEYDSWASFSGKPDDLIQAHYVGIKKGSETLTLTVVKAKQGDIVDKAMAGSSDVAFSKKTIKWQGLDAVEVVGKPKGDTKKADGSTMIFVQVHDFTFAIPGAVEENIDDIDIKLSEYTRFVESIKIDKKAIEAQQQKLTTPTIGKDVQLGAVKAPDDWKQVQQKYGLSFAAPANWKVTEQGEGLNGAVFALTIGANDDLSGALSIIVSESSVDELVTYSQSMAVGFGSKMMTSIEKMKWQGYDARRLIFEHDNKKTSLLFVRVGKYTYNIPDPASSQPSVASGSLDLATFKAFAETVRIDPAKQ